MSKILTLIAIIIIALSGFTIQLGSFKFEYLGLLDVILRILKGGN